MAPASGELAPAPECDPRQSIPCPTITWEQQPVEPALRGHLLRWISTGVEMAATPCYGICIGSGFRDPRHFCARLVPLDRLAGLRLSLLVCRTRAGLVPPARSRGPDRALAER